MAKSRLLLILIGISIASGLFGVLYAIVFYAEADRLHMMRGFRTGFSIAFLTAGFELYFVRSFRQGWFRKLPFMAALVVRIVVITALIRLALIANEALSNLVMSGTLTFGRNFPDQMRDTVVSFSIVVIVVIFAQFSSLIGFHRFVNLLAGRYYRPVREERAFLFLDLKDSSNLTIELGDVRFHEFLSQLFYEADRAIVQTGGEIVAYVGDAVIITWPLLEDRELNARPLLALGAIIKRLEEVGPDFITKYGHAPAIRAALHGGPVVVGECGDSRRQVTFLGEVVNMTARIETEAKLLDTDYLASVTVLKTLDLPENIKNQSIGEVMLKGARAPLELYQIEFK